MRLTVSTLNDEVRLWQVVLERRRGEGWASQEANNISSFCSWFSYVCGGVFSFCFFVFLFFSAFIPALCFSHFCFLSLPMTLCLFVFVCFFSRLFSSSTSSTLNNLLVQ